jgi:hypothetical protein
MKIRSIGRLFLAAAMITLVGCGGGGGGGGTTPVPAPPAQPTKAIVKLATSGTLPAGKSISGIDVTLTYATNKGLSIGASDVVISGVGSGSLLVPNTTTAGQVRLGMISATGIQTGEFATLTFNIASGNSPVAGDFAIAAGASIIDNSSPSALPLSGISATIADVTFQ